MLAAMALSRGDPDAAARIAERWSNTPEVHMLLRSVVEAGGYGFVELQDASDLKATIERLNGLRLSGRVLTINAATHRAKLQQLV